MFCYIIMQCTYNFTDSIEPNMRNYTFVNIPMTWEQARSHCRQHYTDLAMIENESENSAEASFSPRSYIWPGEAWRWSDGSQFNFTNWLTGNPNSGNENCTNEILGHKWNDVPCSLECQFICQGETNWYKLIWNLSTKSLGCSTLHYVFFADFVVKKSMILMTLQIGVDLSPHPNNTASK